MIEVPIHLQTYVIEADPVPWARAGVCRGRFYDKQKHDKLVWGLLIEKQHGNAPLFVGPLAFDITFYFQIPRSHHKKRDEMFHAYHFIRPDVDNCAKFLMDICTGILYKDDSSIASQRVNKVWGDEGRIEFSVFKLPKKGLHELRMSSNAGR